MTSTTQLWPGDNTAVEPGPWQGFGADGVGKLYTPTGLIATPWTDRPPEFVTVTLSVGMKLE